MNGAVGDPILIFFSNGSEAAYGVVAYVRWRRMDGSYKCTMVLAKARIAPLKRITIVRLELDGAVLSKRLHVFIETESRFKFDKVYHLVDSEIGHPMVQKTSHDFRTLQQYVSERFRNIQTKGNGIGLMGNLIYQIG